MTKPTKPAARIRAITERLKAVRLAMDVLDDAIEARLAARIDEIEALTQDLTEPAQPGGKVNGKEAPAVQ